MPEWGPAGSNTYAWPCERANAASLGCHSWHQERGRHDPSILDAGDGGCLRRRGPARPMARDRASGCGGMGEARCGPDLHTRRRAASGLPRSTPVSSGASPKGKPSIDHDVAAFVDVVQESIGGFEGLWIHYGLTSSDVVDTALSATLVRAADLLLVAAARLGLGHETPGPRTRGGADCRADARHARRADDFRDQARSGLPAGRS